MDGEMAESSISRLRNTTERRWFNPQHIATSTFRKGVIDKLSRESSSTGYSGCALVEILLSEILPDIDLFMGIFEVDELGIWYWDGDGSINEAVWRQRLIPWKYVKGLVLHQVS